MVYRTFDEWSSLGYKIIAGSKALYYYQQKPMFSEEQVINREEEYILQLIAECTNPNQ